MFDDDLIKDNSVEWITQDDVDLGLSFDCRVPFYRALPLSCIEAVVLSLNDNPVGTGSISISLRGKTYPLNRVADLMDIWWGFTETIKIVAASDDVINRKNLGNSIKIDFSIKIRLPYLIPTNGVDRPNYDSSRTVRQCILS